MSRSLLLFPLLFSFFFFFFLLLLLLLVVVVVVKWWVPVLVVALDGVSVYSSFVLLILVFSSLSSMSSYLESLMPRNCFFMQTICLCGLDHAHRTSRTLPSWTALLRPLIDARLRWKLDAFQLLSCENWFNESIFCLVPLNKDPKADKLHCNCALSCRVHRLHQVIYNYSTVQCIVVIYIYIQFAALCRELSSS